MMASERITVEELKRQVDWKSSPVACSCINIWWVKDQNEDSGLIAKEVNRADASEQDNADNEAEVVSSAQTNLVTNHEHLCFESPGGIQVNYPVLPSDENGVVDTGPRVFN